LRATLKKDPLLFVLKAVAEKPAEKDEKKAEQDVKEEPDTLGEPVLET
jgi:hypothetical protein